MTDALMNAVVKAINESLSIKYNGGVPLFPVREVASAAIAAIEAARGDEALAGSRHEPANMVSAEEGVEALTRDEARERERCARIAETFLAHEPAPTTHEARWRAQVATDIAAAIRGGR